MRALRNSQKGIDWFLQAAVLLLLFFSLAQLYSIGQHVGAADRFVKQVLFVIAGLVVLLIFSYVNYAWWQSWSIFLYAFGVLLLALVLFLGSTVRGSRGWFVLGGLNLQPVEFMHAAFIVFLAQFFSSQPRERSYFASVALSFVYLVIPLGLVLLQPDLGSGLVLIAMWLVFIFLSPRMRLTTMLTIGVAAVVIAVISWSFVFAPYQKARVLTFLNPSSDPLGRGYNVRQSIIAIGSGKVWGRGLGLGPQSQLNFLPEKSTDFIFASLGEELGFVGTGLVLIVFFVIFLRLYSLSQRSSDDFTYLLCCGIIALLGCKCVINIGMNIGLLPVTGLPLPFLSYGGSAFLTSMMLIGLAQSVSRRLTLQR